MLNRSLFFSFLLAATTLLVPKSSFGDSIPPVVTSINPAADSPLVQLRTIEVFFSEDVQGVDAADLLINGAPATNVTVISASQYRFNVAQQPSGIVYVGW